MRKRPPDGSLPAAVFWGNSGSVRIKRLLKS
jgi:hypothetical protein